MRNTLEASWGQTEGRVSIWHRPKAGKGNPVNRQKWFAWPAESDKAVAYAESLADKDAYLAVSVFSKDDRSPEFATMVSTVWCDADLCHPSNFRLQPSRIVRSSNGNGDRWQCWWDLADPITAEEASQIARTIAFAHKDQGADQSSWPANKLMRIPGSVNTNWSEEPFVVEEEITGNIYSELDLLGAYDDVEIPKAAPTQKLAVEVNAVTPEDLPDVIELLDRVPASNGRLNDLIYKTPEPGPDGWRSEHRWALILDLLRAGFNDDETLAIVWSRPAAQKWREDPAGRGIDGLAAEVKKARETFQAESKAVVVVAPELVAVKPVKKASLLSKAERKLFEDRQTFDTDYLQWARGKVTVFNAPLHEANVWLLLGSALGTAGYVPKKKGVGMPLNFYIYQISESSSGKTEAKDICWTVIRKLYPGDSPDIGGDHSGNALIEQLLERVDKVSIIHADEAHGRLKEAAQGSWQTGIIEKWTLIYDGWIPQQGRVGRGELRNPDARAVPMMHMMGTPGGMFNVLNRDMFLSGYLARQIWAIGDTFETTRESLEEEQAEGDVVTEYEGMPKYWANRFAVLRQKMLAGLPAGAKDRPMLMTKEALTRMTDVKWEIKQHFDQLNDTEIFTPSARRLGDNIRKAATLIAMSRGKTFVSTYDVVIAIGYAEKWISALERVANGISDTYFSKQLDEIEKYIASREGQEAPVQHIYVQRKEPKRITDEFLLNLISQGRIEERPNTKAGGAVFYRIRQTSKKFKKEDES